MSAETMLDTPLLLIAMPQVDDDFFQRGVVLLMHHDEEGSVGLILNRPTDLEVSTVLEEMELEWEGEEEESIYFGGPVRPQIGTVLFDPGEDVRTEIEAAAEIMPRLAVTQHIGDLGLLASSPPPRFRLFLGYAGWGEGQLMEELLRNDWLTAPPRLDLVFPADPHAIWDSALRSIDVDPASLPAWNVTEAAGGAN